MLHEMASLVGEHESTLDELAAGGSSVDSLLALDRSVFDTCLSLGSRIESLVFDAAPDLVSTEPMDDEAITEPHCNPDENQHSPQSE